MQEDPRHSGRGKGREADEQGNGEAQWGQHDASFISRTTTATTRRQLNSPLRAPQVPTYGGTKHRAFAPYEHLVVEVDGASDRLSIGPS